MASLVFFGRYFAGIPYIYLKTSKEVKQTELVNEARKILMCPIPEVALMREDLLVMGW